MSLRHHPTSDQLRRARYENARSEEYSKVRNALEDKFWKVLSADKVGHLVEFHGPYVDRETEDNGRRKTKDSAFVYGHMPLEKGTSGRIPPGQKAIEAYVREHFFNRPTYRVFAPTRADVLSMISGEVTNTYLPEALANEIPARKPSTRRTVPRMSRKSSPFAELGIEDVVIRPEQIAEMQLQATERVFADMWEVLTHVPFGYDPVLMRFKGRQVVHDGLDRPGTPIKTIRQTVAPQTTPVEDVVEAYMKRDDFFDPEETFHVVPESVDIWRRFSGYVGTIPLSVPQAKKA